MLTSEVFKEQERWLLSKRDRGKQAFLTLSEQSLEMYGHCVLTCIRVSLFLNLYKQESVHIDSSSSNSTPQSPPSQPVRCLSCSTGVPCFMLHLIVFHRRCAFDTLKSRPSTSKATIPFNVILALLQWS